MITGGLGQMSRWPRPGPPSAASRAAFETEILLGLAELTIYDRFGSADHPLFLPHG
jgi:hypothetical protein